MTELIFIRHGETDYNRQQRFQGQVDVPLNANGLAQAQRLGARLAAEAPDLLVCSDLIRTQQTAAPLVAAWGMKAQLDAGFREQNFGLFEGLAMPDIKTQHAGLWQQWLVHAGDFALPGGESLLQFHARVLGAVRALAAAHAGRKVVVVSHGGVLDMLWRTARGEPIEGLRTCDIPNTGINRMHWSNGTLAIEQWADAEHLVGLPEQAGTAAGER